MVNIYACLVGNWVCLNDDPDCVMVDYGQSPNTWWEENASIWSPIHKEVADTMYQLDYLKIRYKGKVYRINPIHIQIVYD
nr:MAG TPA: hypothetical protein [Bacteriophage sp.]